jgi:hypothetical protein
MGRITPSSGIITEDEDNFVKINKIPQVRSVIKTNIKLWIAEFKNLLLAGRL